MVASVPHKSKADGGIINLALQCGAFPLADVALDVELLAAGDLVITADVPLAAAAIEKGGVALNPRGELYTSENVRERLSVRNFLDELRGSGVNTGGPAALSQRERQLFANQLDRLLAKHIKPSPG